MLNSNLKSTVSSSGYTSYQMKAILGLCLPLLDTRSAVGRRVWMEGKIFSLSYNNFPVLGIRFITAS
jgi:hypothetical protein